ncbi:hypothetical protein SDC9_116968 [bioreactor metagenome]|uniref:HTH LytTR-type domain-containing protein n=1 Tax=bioreactor metagenome TaxID=1076179 RepID=A0A645BY33_9ZZZZ
MRTDGLSDSSEHIREVMSIIRPLYYSIRIQGRRLYILLDSIIYAEKNNNDLIIHGVKHRYLQRKNLYDFASEITMITNSFLKISRSFMVNMAHIKSIKARIMTLSNGDQLTIPQKRLPEIKIAYYNYLNTAEK